MTMKYFDDGSGTQIWVSWNDDRSKYEVGKSEAEAKERLKGIDWRHIALCVLTNRINELPANIEEIVLDATGGSSAHS